MVPLLGLFFLLAATNDPLPKELEYRLSLARALPAPYSGAVIVALLPSAKLSSRQIVALADEAYHLAVKDPASAVRAWIAYRDNFDQEKEPALAFPIQAATAKVGCDVLAVDDPRDYYRSALEAGPKEFEIALRNVRSAVEVGRLLEALLLAGSGEQTRLVPQVSRLLGGATGSDREFVAAVRFTRLHAAVLRLAVENAAAGRVLLGSYRGFLTANWQGKRCAGNRSEEFKGIIEEFNQAAAKVRGVAPLGPEAARVLSVETVTKAELPQTFPLGYKIMNAPIDAVSVRSMLHELQQFQLEEKLDSPGTLPAKAFLYGKLAQRLEGSVFLSTAMAEWAHFVAYSRLREENQEDWFRCARRFYEWARGNRARQDMLETAGDPALTAYIKLTTLLPESEVARVLP